MRRRRLTDPIQVRLDPESRAQLEADAATRRVLLSELIRERLDLAQLIEDRIDALREDVAFKLGDHDRRQEKSSLEKGIQLETLLLLRAIAGPHKQTMATAEVEGLGLSVWRGEAW